MTMPTLAATVACAAALLLAACGGEDGGGSDSAAGRPSSGQSSQPNSGQSATNPPGGDEKATPDGDVPSAVKVDECSLATTLIRKHLPDGTSRVSGEGGPTQSCKWTSAAKGTSVTVRTFVPVEFEPIAEAKQRRGAEGAKFRGLPDLAEQAYIKTDDSPAVVEINWLTKSFSMEVSSDGGSRYGSEPLSEAVMLEIAKQADADLAEKVGR